MLAHTKSARDGVEWSIEPKLSHARRFLREYRDRIGMVIDDATLRWHQSVVCLRALVEVAAWAAAGELDEKAGHPWLTCGPAFATRVTELTGEPVRSR